MCITCASGAPGSQQRVLEPMTLELWVVEIHLVGLGNQSAFSVRAASAPAAVFMLCFSHLKGEVPYSPAHASQPCLMAWLALHQWTFLAL